MERKHTKIFLYLLLMIFNLGDVLTTMVGISRGARETNPVTLFLWSHIGFLPTALLKLFLPFLIFFFWEYLGRKSVEGKKWISWIVLICVFVFAVVSISNTIQIFWQVFLRRKLQALLSFFRYCKLRLAVSPFRGTLLTLGRNFFIFFISLILQSETAKA